MRDKDAFNRTNFEFRTIILNFPLAPRKYPLISRISYRVERVKRSLLLPLSPLSLLILLSLRTLLSLLTLQPPRLLHLKRQSLRARLLQKGLSLKSSLRSPSSQSLPIQHPWRQHLLSMQLHRHRVRVCIWNCMFYCLISLIVKIYLLILALFTYVVFLICD